AEPVIVAVQAQDQGPSESARIDYEAVCGGKPVLFSGQRSPGVVSADIGLYGALVPVSEPWGSILERPASLTSMTWGCAGSTAVLNVLLARPTSTGAEYFYSRTFVRADGTVVVEPLTPWTAADAARLMEAQ